MINLGGRREEGGRVRREEGGKVRGEEGTNGGLRGMEEGMKERGRNGGRERR